MISSVKKTGEILNKYNLRAKKGYGQNFIIESGVVKKIADNAYAEEAVIEIGPGIGALTQQLALISKKVLAFEIDEKLIPVLKDVLSEYPNVEVVNRDILDVDLEETVNGLLVNYSRVVVCANLPYYITTPILFNLFESKANIEYITVMVQKEVADRFNAKVNTENYNALSVITQYLYEVSLVMNVRADVFIPKPKVDSAVIQFKRKGIKDKINRDDFFKFVKACFKQRRKTLYNNLKEYINDKELVLEVLKAVDLSNNVRAQELVLDEFINLYEVYYERKCLR